jgi:hypothetical protein
MTKATIHRKRRAVATTEMITSNSTVTSTTTANTGTTAHRTTESIDSINTNRDTILRNAFTNPYIKSILEQQQQQQQQGDDDDGGGGGIFYQPAITLIRQSSSIFMHQFVAAISNHIQQQQQHPQQQLGSASAPITTITTSTDTHAHADEITEQSVLRAMRDVITNHADFQFLLGTLDNIEHSTTTSKRKQPSKSLLLPASITDRAAVPTKKKPSQPHTNDHIATTDSSTTKTTRSKRIGKTTGTAMEKRPRNNTKLKKAPFKVAPAVLPVPPNNVAVSNSLLSTTSTTANTDTLHENRTTSISQPPIVHWDQEDYD